MDVNYIRSIKLKSFPDDDSYISKLPAIKYLKNNELEFKAPVTFFCGENGTGKSTLLEAIAVAFGFNPEGGTLNFCFNSYDSHSYLYKHIGLVKGYNRPKDGFFLRAESYYNVASYIEELDSISSPTPLIKESYGGKSLHECSHGESFMAMVQNRLGGKGLYIFDEPEAALSPQRQMTLLCEIDRLVKNDSQLIIVTHSPILLSYPNAEIYQLSENGLDLTEYKDTLTYSVTKQFLNYPERMLEILLED